MLTMGNCRVCGTGPLGLRVCGFCRRLVLLCDECDAAWRDATPTAPPTYADEHGMPCPHCRASLWENGARWATRAEADATEWVEDSGVELDEGDSFEPRR